MSQKNRPNKEKKMEKLDQEMTPSLINNINYIKDLSFENPGVLKEMSDPSAGPQLDINIHVDAAPVGDDVYEVVLLLKAKANQKNENLFLLELAYAGIFRVRETATEDERKELLLIDAPSLLFPFARTIVANITREGGLPPLLLNPVNFEAMYAQTANETESLKH